MDAGDIVGGFRIERRLGRGSFGTVYEATQLSLGRAVALRLLDGRDLADPELAERFRVQQRLSASIHHPNLVPTYEAGEWEGGRFVATRFIRGRALADLLDDGALDRASRGAILAQLTAALGTVHEAGLAHGRVRRDNVLVDPAGTPFLADLGLGRPGSAEADRKGLAALAAELDDVPARRSLPRLIAPVAVAAAAAAAVVLLAAGGDAGADTEDDPPPPVAAGALPLGSELSRGPALSLGCEQQPGPNTPACTIGQSTIAGRVVRVPQAGVIRSWAVRGAAGDLALQVIGRRDGGPFLSGFSQVERVADRGANAFEANVRVRRGDRIGVMLAPGASIGSREPQGGASALHWEGTLSFVPEPQRSEPIGRELLLRADIEPGARPELEQITGARAAAAADGRVLAEQALGLPSGPAVRIELARIDGEIVVDAVDGRRRIVRAAVADADPSGRLLSLEVHCGYQRGFCVRWLNEGASAPVVHAYRLARGTDGLRPIG